MDKESALALAAELQTQGYIKPLEEGLYAFTDKGEKLVRASAAGKVRRQTAENALIGLLARVEQYNSDPNKLLTVEAVVVFGSFLAANDNLVDLDIAVKHRHRNPNDPDPAATALAYAERSSRHFSNIVEWVSWPETELRQFLTARKRTIAIQDWHAFLRMTASTTPGEGLGLISSDSTFVSRMIIRQIPAPGAWRRVAATQIRVRQTLQIVGEWSPLGFPLPARKRLELSAKSPWPPPPSNVRDGQHAPSTGFWFSRQVVE